MNFQDVIREVYDRDSNALRTTGNFSASLGGNVTLNPGPNFIGIVTVANPGAFSGNVTLDPGSKTQIVGNLTLSDPKGFIGLVTVVGSLSPAAGNVTLDPGSKTGIVGNITLSDSKGFIGLTTVGGGYLTTYPQIYNGTDFEAFNNTKYLGLVTATVGNTPTVFIGTPTLFAVVNSGAAADPKIYIGLTTTTLGVSDRFVGLVTVVQSSSARSVVGNLTLTDSKTFVGLVTSVNGGGDRFIGLVTSWVSGIAGNVTLSDAKTYVGLTTTTLGIGTQFIGLVTVVQSSAARTITGNLTLSDSKTFVGLVTSVNGAGDRYIGLVTASALNAGTTKTLIPLPVGLGNNSIATVAVPTNANRVRVTNLVLNSNVTTEIAIKSGVTYLTGNASLGITIYPGGGFVNPGSPDSPSWIGLPSGALVVEKRDPGGTVSKIAGQVIYFDE